MLVNNNDGWGIVAEAGDEVEPMIEAALVFTSAGIDDDEVKAASGKEKLVRGLVNALTTEVPKVEGNGIRD